MREVQRAQLAAERELGRAIDTTDELTLDQVRALVASVHDAAAELSNADPRLKARVHPELGVQVTYQPTNGQATVSAHVLRVGVGGGT